MKKACLLLLFFTPLLCLAQSNFKPGYVITFKGDTVRGQINYKEWFENPSSVVFKASSGTPQTYTAKTISYFNINGNVDYEAVITTVSLDHVDNDNLSTGIDNTIKTDTIFLKVLSKGNNVTLYSYTDNVKARYYIRDNNSKQLQELVYKSYLSPENASAILHQKKYAGQLTVLAQTYHQDSPKNIAFITNASYNQDDMLRAIALINDINLSEAKRNANTPRAYRLYAGLGVSMSDLSFSGNYILTNSSSKTNTPMPKVSFGLDFYTNPDIRQLIIRLELFSYLSKNSLENRGSVNYLPTDETLNVTRVAFGFSPQVIYNIYNTDKFKAYLGAGLGIELNSYPTDVTTATTTISSTLTTTTTQNGFPAMTKFLFNIPLKAGVFVSKNVEITGTYILPVAITDNYPDFSGNLTTYQLGVNYSLGK